MATTPVPASLYECPVVESRSVGAYHLVSFSAADIAEQARPGQFLMVRQAGPALDPLLPRPMGIHDVESDLVKVLIEPVGKGTRSLSQAKVGDRFSVLGPLGNGFNLEGKGEALIIGGGVGAAPLAYLAKILTEEGRRVHCILGFKTRGQAVVAELFGEIEVDICTEDGTMGQEGMVSDLLAGSIAELGGKASRAEMFACGPEGMLRAVAEAGRGCGAQTQIAVAAHMACGIGACQGCVISAGGEYRRACIDGPVFSAGELEW